MLVDFVNLTHARVIWEEKPELKNASIRLLCRQACEGFCLMIDMGGPSSLWAVSDLNRWSWVVHEK